MKVRIILGEFPFKHGGKASPELEKNLFEIFAQYQPCKSSDITGTYGYQAYEFTALADDPRLETLLQDFSTVLKNTTPPAAAYFGEAPVGEEAKRVRFFEPYYYSSYVDEGPGCDPSRFYLCKECNWPNLDYLPETLLVNKSVLKKYDVFHAQVNMIVVRPHVLELLKNAVGDEIQFGEAAIAKSKAKATGDDRLFWVRPKKFLGHEVRIIGGERSCSVCKRARPIGFFGADDKIKKRWAWLT